ncbi:MAG: LysR family transcriptional regulator [Coriobacteriia bacterium]|nr:LysR family transcriptional regulator [Coriobacteriia bacterium]MBN2822211.1 LysR family transcriptional regulator [Coriobacteriia bacterium]
MNCTQMRYFLAIARHKKFSSAAEHAYVSQSALSKQIKSLEEELGVELFVRSSAGATLTPAGEAFLEYAHKAYLDYEGILRRLERYDSTAQNRVRIGTLPLMGAYDLYSDFADFQIENMTTQIDMYERNQSEIIRRMEINRLDAAILRTDLLSTDDYEWIPLFRDELVIVCSNTHPLARTRRTSLVELKDERFVMLEEESAIYTRFVEDCRRLGFYPNITFTHARHEPLLAAVSKNIGITTLPRGLTHGRTEPTISTIPLTEPLFTDIGLVYPKGRELTPSAAAFIEFFAKAYKTPAETDKRQGNAS